MTQNRHLGRYELLEQLGEGGMGTVWLARLSGSHGFEKLCIVKTVLPSIAKDAEFVSRFLHEGRVLTQLAHGNIAQVLDMNEFEGQLFLALEYVAGVDLARLADNVRNSKEFMPLPMVVMLIAQAAEGLGSAHRKSALDGTPLNVVHRDVSPHNIMVSFEGEVKVIDFGIAKSEARSRHTAQASVMGKLGYMAPEQARGDNVDHRADQYALAIVLWELLTNQPFIRRGTLTEMVVAMAHPNPKPLSPLRTDVPPSLEAVVVKALAASAEARYADTDAFARALTGEVLALGAPPTKPQLGEYVKLKCTLEFGAQRHLLTRVSTMRGLSSESERPMSDDPLVTPVRPAPPGATDQLTHAARPGLVDSGALTKSSMRGGSVPIDARDLPDAPLDATMLSPSTTPGRPSLMPAGAAGVSMVPGADVAAPTVPSPTVNVRPPGLASPSDPSPTVRDRPPGLASPSDPSPTVRDRPLGFGASADPTLREAPPGIDELARPAAPVPSGRPAVARAEAPSLTTGEIAAAIPKRSKAPLFIGVFAVLGIIAAVFFATRPGESPVGERRPVAVIADAGSSTPVPVEVVVVDAGALPVAIADPPSDAPKPANGVITNPPGFDDPPVEPKEPPSKKQLRFIARATPTTWVVTNSNRSTLKGCTLTFPGKRRFTLGKFDNGVSREIPHSAATVSERAQSLDRKARLDCAEGVGFAKL